MYRKFLKSKIHRVTVTGADLNYEGSITIDLGLLEKAGILAGEFVQVVNLANGARFETYTIAGEKNSGVIEINGAAARMAQPGDLLIVMSHIYQEEPLPEKWNPAIILVDEKNRVKEN